MSGFDRVLYATQERLTSSDLNQDARIRSRNLMEIVRLLSSSVELNTDTDAEVTQRTTGTVLGGLKVIQGTGGVQVSDGVLAHYWSGAGTQPSTDESQFVIGEQRGVVALPIATPGADTWYLVQARATTTVTNETRDIWNPGTGSFSGASSLKRHENTVELNAKAGTATDIPLSDAGWIPLAGVKMLASGVSPTTAEIVDVRPLYDRFNVSVQTRGIGRIDSNLYTTHFDAINVVAGNGVAFNFDAHSDIGHFYARTTGSSFVDVTEAAFKDPSTTLAADTWYYLYLAGWNLREFTTCAPRQAYNNVVSQGLLVLSHVGPTSQGTRNMPASVNLPPPFAQDPSRVGTCVCALRRNANNDGWVAMQVSENRAAVMRFSAADRLADGASPVLLASGIGFPTNARRATLSVERAPGTSYTYVDLKRASSQVMKRVATSAGYERCLVTIPLQNLTPSAIQAAAEVPGEDLRVYLEELEF